MSMDTRVFRRARPFRNFHKTVMIAGSKTNGYAQCLGFTQV